MIAILDMSFYLTYLIHIKIIFPNGSARRLRITTPGSAKRLTLRLELMLSARTALNNLLSVRVSTCMHLCDLNLVKK